MAKAIAVVLLLLGFVAISSGQDNCRGFISTGCCCTSNCCFEIDLADLQQIDNERYRIVASGQIIHRTGWSPDGRAYRCACDSINGKWVVHPTALTRCLYLPMQGS